MERRALVPTSGGNREDWTRLTALTESSRAVYRRLLMKTLVWGASRGGSKWTAQPASQARLGEGGGSIGIGSSCMQGTADLLAVRWVSSGMRRSWYTLRGNGGAHSPASRHIVISASSTASMSSPMVCGFLIPAACRRGRGRAYKYRSTTTHSATWAVLGLPASNQCWASRLISAAWARAGNRLLYSQARNNWAVMMGDKPTHARISFRSSS
ncbi:uncharacterized protein LOC132132609 [Carassius carassius]|uniref:uncharacterized protein LOC132132609 n=1 Tax=Carassius carassius TaxID=217509 RepID=UPI00286954E8|nr:uncharacterized protein LOC132132609 [Carassius carassius]